jgi:hypothetical protein
MMPLIVDDARVPFEEALSPLEALTHLVSNHLVIKSLDGLWCRDCLLEQLDRGVAEEEE